MLSLNNVEAVLNKAGLRNPTLPFLDRNPVYVRILMLQPIGVIEASDDQVRVRDRALLTAQVKAFLVIANDRVVDLAICPEYSCTWDAVLETVESGVFPAEGKLWALGCESATTPQLTAALERLQERVTVIYDDASVAPHGNFVDVLLYLFRTHRKKGGKSTWTALLQPKTQPMGGTSFELHALRTGSTLYRFTNNTAPSNSLVGLVCSDVLHPQFEQFIPQLRTDTFVLHLQLNDNPSMPGFRKYRSDCCQHVPRTSEILWLNWARGTTVIATGEHAEHSILEPKSILFRDKQQLRCEDTHVMANDVKGCYLTNWEDHRSAAFVFSPDPHLFFFETTKPSLAGHAATAQRYGPQMIELRSWGEGAMAWQVVNASDRFESYWMQAYPEVRELLHPLLPNYFEAERLIQLSVGHAAAMGWGGFWKLRSFELADDDTTCRLTLCWSTTGRGLEYRQDCLSLFRGFAGAITEGIQSSNRLGAFKGGQFTIRYHPSNLAQTFRNMHATAGPSATGIFLGLAPPNERLVEVKKRTMDGLRQTDSDMQLLAIWYRDATGQLHDFMDEEIPKINADPQAGPVAIDNTAS